jgi:hypothetical protein
MAFLAYLAVGSVESLASELGSRREPEGMTGVNEGHLMSKSKFRGAMLATAVGVMFLVRPALGDNSGQSQAPSSSQKQSQVKCVGGNSCKGQSACMSASNSCSGQNACKGKGYVMATNAQECGQKGGHVEKN